MTNISDHPTKKANANFSFVNDDNADPVLRIANYFSGLKTSIKYSLDTRPAVSAWESLAKIDADNSFIVLKDLCLLLYECNIENKSSDRHRDKDEKYHINDEEDQLGNSRYISAIDRLSDKRSKDKKIIESSVHEFKYRYFLPGAFFEPLMEVAFPNDDPAEYIAKFLESFFDGENERVQYYGFELNQNSIECGFVWVPLLLNIANWIDSNDSNKSTLFTINYLLEGWERSDSIIIDIQRFSHIARCGNHILYKSAIKKLFDGNELTIFQEPDPVCNSAAFITLFLPLFSNTDMLNVIEARYDIPSAFEEIKEEMEQANILLDDDSSKEEMTNIMLASTMKNIISGSLKDKSTQDSVYRVIVLTLSLTIESIKKMRVWPPFHFNGKFTLSCVENLSELRGYIYSEDYFPVLEKLNSGYTVFRNSCLRKRSDITLWDAGKIYKIISESVCLGESDEDCLQETDIDLSFIIGQLSEYADFQPPIIDESKEAYPDEDAEIMSDGILSIYYPFAIDPWSVSGVHEFVKNAHERWERYKIIIVKLRDEKLDKVADAFLSFYIVTEGVARQGDYADWEGLARMISQRLSNHTYFIEDAIVWIRKYLQENDNWWEDMRFNQFNIDLPIDQDSEVSLIRTFTEGANVPVERFVIENIGNELFNSLSSRGKELLLVTHNSFNMTLPLFSSGRYTECGSIATGFFNFMEHEMKCKIHDIYTSESYRKWKKNKDKKWSNNPTMGQFLHLLREVNNEETPNDVTRLINCRITLHKHIDFIKKLSNLFYTYRNKAAHGDEFTWTSFLKVFDMLYGRDKNYMVTFIEYLQPKTKNI